MVGLLGLEHGTDLLCLLFKVVSHLLHIYSVPSVAGSSSTGKSMFTTVGAGDWIQTSTPIGQEILSLHRLSNSDTPA